MYTELAIAESSVAARKGHSRPRPLTTLAVFILSVAAILDCTQPAAWAAARNIALGCPYTMTKPTYKLCTDPGDNTQQTAQSPTRCALRFSKR